MPSVTSVKDFSAPNGLRLIDLHYTGRPGLVSVWVIDDVLVDCGPSARLDTLLTALGDWQPKRLLLTHIHLDHAGAAGALCNRWPDLTVFVHERGAPHLLDPTRLLRSARRVFGSELDVRFGPMTPVPEKNLHVLAGGETLDEFDTVYTPGHASHHISYLHRPTGTAFPGDVAGVRLDRLLIPPTPPPDIDLDLWRQSIAAIEAWSPPGLALPHFGFVSDVDAQLTTLRARLDEHEQRAGAQTQEQYVAAFALEASQHGDEAFMEAASVVVPPDQNYVGLRRWIDSQPGT